MASATTGSARTAGIQVLLLRLQPWMCIAGRWRFLPGWRRAVAQEHPATGLLAKIQLTAPGSCRHLGYLRNFLAEGDCAAGVVSIVIPGYVERWGYELDKYQVYARFVLLDSDRVQESVSGRSIHNKGPVNLTGPFN